MVGQSHPLTKNVIDIVIVNWNSGHWIKKCLDSIFKSTQQELISQVFLVDNFSTDNSLQEISPHPNLKIIANMTNKGFAAACNQGIHHGDSKYVVMVNPDALVESNTLVECFNFMEANSEVDICGVKQKDENGLVRPSCARFPTPLRFLFDAAGLSKMAPHFFKPATLMTDWDHLSSKKVDQIMGSFMFIRRDVFSRIGFFDERFFVYFEELDLSKRLSDAGGISFYNHTISIVHGGEGTTKNVKAFRLFLSLKSRLQYSRKHFSLGGFISTCFSTYVIEFVSRIFYSLLSGKSQTISETWKAYKLLISNGPDMKE